MYKYNVSVRYAVLDLKIERNIKILKSGLDWSDIWSDWDSVEHN